MIEIGRESGISLAFRRTASTLVGVSSLLGIIWIARGILGIQQYSYTILLVGFSLAVLGRILRTKTSSGIGRTAQSLLWNLTAAMGTIIISIWFLGWIASLQDDVFPVTLSSLVPELAIIGVTTGLGAYAIRKLGIVRRWGTPNAFVVSEGKGPVMEGTRLSLKRDTVGMPVNRDGRTIGCVLLGDVSTSFQTPMGAVSASLPGPVTTIGVPFQGRTVSKEEVLRLTGKTPTQLSEESIQRAENVEIGKLRIRDGCMGERWKIGPLIFDWDADGEHHSKERWLAKGVGNSYITTDGQQATAKWNGSNLSVGDGTMQLTVGSDSFSYSPREVKTSSPHHTLQVKEDQITLDTRKFTLKVMGDSVVLRTENKTNKTESKTLANDLRTLLTETAKKHVRDVMEGNPIDLSEMFSTTEEVLAKHD